jgi:glutathione S-transferase
LRVPVNCVSIIQCFFNTNEFYWLTMPTDRPHLILWGVSTSRTLRALWALHELDLTYTLHPIQPRTGETQTLEFTKINPRRKIPVLQDGDFTIAESPAIIAYLSETYGTPNNELVPREARYRAQWLEWCFHIAMELDATSLYVMRRHRDLKHIYGESPIAVDSASQYFETQLRHVVQALGDGRTYLVNERFSSADMLLTTCLVWAVNYGVPLPGVCLDYVARIAQRPAYQVALRANIPPSPPTEGSHV